MIERKGFLCYNEEWIPKMIAEVKLMQMWKDLNKQITILDHKKENEHIHKWNS
jgi:hypothetical protein